MTWPIAFSGKTWDNPLAQVYRVYQIPTTYLLDRDGIIRYRDLSGAELARRVAELLQTPAPVAARVPDPIPIPWARPGRSSRSPFPPRWGSPPTARAPSLCGL